MPGWGFCSPPGFALSCAGDWVRGAVGGDCVCANATAAIAVSDSMLRTRNMTLLLETNFDVAPKWNVKFVANEVPGLRNASQVDRATVAERRISDSVLR